MIDESFLKFFNLGSPDFKEEDFDLCGSVTFDLSFLKLVWLSSMLEL